MRCFCIIEAEWTQLERVAAHITKTFGRNLCMRLEDTAARSQSEHVANSFTTLASKKVSQWKFIPGALIPDFI